MKKKLLLMLAGACIAMSASAQVAIDEEHFPNALFRNYVSTNFDTDKDGTLSTTEANKVTALGITSTAATAGVLNQFVAPFSAKAIVNTSAFADDLTGIEYFTNLQVLNLRHSPVTKLDLSKNTKLKWIMLGWCEKLTEVTFPTQTVNTATNVYLCGCSKLEKLDLSPLKATGGVNLYMAFSRTATSASNTSVPSATTYTTYALASCKEVVLPSRILSTTLPLAYMTSLEKLDFTNHLATSAPTTLNVTGCAKLKEVDITNSKIATVTASGTATVSNPMLKVIDNRTASSSKVALTATYVEDTEDNIYNALLTNKNLTSLTMQNGKFTSVRLPDLPKFVTANFNNSATLTKIDLSENSHITNLSMNSTGITPEGLTLNPNMTGTINMNGCPNLTSLDVTKLPAGLTSLGIYNNPQLAVVDFTGAPNLSNLFIGSNGWDHVDLSPLTSLKVLNASTNAVVTDGVATYPNHNTWKEIDLSHNTGLTQLFLNGSRELEKLDISKHNSLGFISVNETGIKELTTPDGDTISAMAPSIFQANSDRLLYLDMSKVNCQNAGTWAIGSQRDTLAVTGFSGKVGLKVPTRMKAENIDSLKVGETEIATPTIETYQGNNYLVLANTAYNEADWQNTTVTYKYNTTPYLGADATDETKAAWAEKQWMDVTVVTLPGEVLQDEEVEVFVSELGKADDGKYYASMYYSDKALTVPTGVTAYTYKVADGALTVSKTYATGDVIPAGQAVIIAADNTANFTFEAAPTAGTADTGSMLLGTDEQKSISESGYIYYMLSTPPADSEYGIGFWWQVDGGHSIINGAHKAYLRVPEDAAASIKGFNFGGNTTGIKTVDELTSRQVDEAAWYTLDGQQLNAAPTQKGVYLQNGKKVVLK